MAGRPGTADASLVKTTNKNAGEHARVHVPYEDRVRTAAGKTVDSKVRSEGRAWAALERRSRAQHIYAASRAGH